MLRKAFNNKLYRKKNRGFTIIELAVTVSVLAAGLVSILKLSGELALRSTDPMLQRHTLVFAKAYIEEISGKEFSTGTCPAIPGAGNREDYTHACHYDTGGSQVSVNDQEGTTVDAGGYLVQVDVSNTAFHDLTSADAQRIEVLVLLSAEGNATKLVTYRTNY